MTLTHCYKALARSSTALARYSRRWRNTQGAGAILKALPRSSKSLARFYTALARYSRRWRDDQGAAALLQVAGALLQGAGEKKLITFL
jgi:hypothetical protein